MAQNLYNGAQLAPWWKRAACLLLDRLIASAAATPVGVVMAIVAVAAVGFTSGATSGGGTHDRAFETGAGLFILGAILLGSAAIAAFVIWNRCTRRGRTGKSLGSQAADLRLVDADTGLPIGGWRAFGRECLHILDALPFGLGFLFPLWTPKQQTFADMIMNTVVVVDRRPDLPGNITSFGYQQPQQYQPYFQPQFQPQFQPTASGPNPTPSWLKDIPESGGN